jgi:hypothetical protein
MPIEGVRYRFRPIAGGRKQRLAFRNDGTVVEAVTYNAKGEKTGAAHTPSEFKADAKAKAKRKPLRLRSD